MITKKCYKNYKIHDMFLINNFKVNLLISDAEDDNSTTIPYFKVNATSSQGKNY